MSEPDVYRSPQAVARAISDAAQAAARRSDRPVGQIVRQEDYRRFLARVFIHGDGEARWVLKGGNALLARVPEARTTRDVDLLGRVEDLDDAQRELELLVSEDLGDHFTFALSRTKDQGRGDAQPYLVGRRLVFDTRLGTKKRGPISVDLVVGTQPIGQIRSQKPQDILGLSKLPNAVYQLYPIEDHIADKVCAMLESHAGGMPSSREKDLVDLVIMALVDDEWAIEAGSLGQALRIESRRRKLDLPDRLVAPSSWGSGYASQVKQTAAQGFATVEAAMGLMRDFLDPVMAGVAAGRWDPRSRRWG
ncbi:MAG: nucleotidyl transferase AbiEii/AbiGii toxin family protein [Actinomycetia bacterium]|nr:nucleotidyl transferase AbiEii/AbiGii toxin family protein [Actinomycetes bacterium]